MSEDKGFTFSTNMPVWLFAIILILLWITNNFFVFGTGWATAMYYMLNTTPKIEKYLEIEK